MICSCHAMLCRTSLFSKDFQKHLEAIDMIMGELSRDQEPIMASLDLLLRQVHHHIACTISLS